MKAGSFPIRRTGLHLVLLLLLGASAWWGIRYWLLARHWQAAQAALDDNDAQRAYEELRPCLAAWFERSDVLLVGARAARLAGRLDDAEAHLAACERLASTNHDVRFERLLLQLRQGDLLSNTETVRRLLASSDARQTVLLLAIAEGLLEIRQMEQAAPYLAKAERDAPNSGAVWMLNAELNMRLNNALGARPFLDKAVAQSPRALLPRLRLAQCLLQLGEAREAAGHLDLLERDGFCNAEVLWALARCRIYRGELGTARDVLDRMLLAFPRHVDALIERSRLEFRTGNAVSARSWLRRALEINPDAVLAWQVRAACHAAAQEEDQARTCRVEVKRLEFEFGRAQIRVERIAASATLRADELADTGECWLRLHNYDEAQRYLVLALQVEPRHPAAHRNLAKLFEETEQPHRAARHRDLTGSGQQPSRQSAGD